MQLRFARQCLAVAFVGNRSWFEELRRLTVAGVVVLGLAGGAWAQGVTGSVAGTVKDAQGGVIPGATVVLISQSQGTRSVPVVTNATGDFAFPNVNTDTYTVQVEMPGFSTLRRPDVVVSAGSRTAVGTLTLAVGGQQEVITVTSEVPLIQATTGERSFTVETESVTNLPVMRRTYDGLLALAPGVETSTGLTFASRVGGGGQSNFMLDGNTAMDPGVNRAAARVSVEAIAEVKVATSNYQAEYGRSSGLQINAVTKSGSNQFHGSLYDVERKSAWNANSKTNILNGDPKEFNEERDWGFSIGGPVGKPGGDNKLFFYFNQEFNPRTQGNSRVTRRFPTALERQGDFSQSRDNRGNLYNLIRDTSTGLPCTASNHSGCFQDGGVLGRIPADRLYETGLNILRWYPMPNIDNPPAGQNYNYEAIEPGLSLLGYQPILRVDYQALSNLRGTFKYLMYQQPSKVHPGLLPGWDDSKEDDYGIYVPSATVNWTVNSATFVEGSWGGNYHHQEGCSVTGGAPNFCRNALRINPSANRFNAGMGDIPYLFPDATIIEPGTFAHWVLERQKPPVWDGTRVTSVPEFSWGSRISPAPPNNVGPFGNFILDTRTSNLNLSVTRVQGSHNLKVGYYYWWSLQRRGQGDMLGVINFGQDSNNPLDTTFGFSNAAVGVFSSYSQLSRWGEGAYTAINHEFYAQDNWKVRPNVTLDYGLRFVHQKPQFDGYYENSNFLPDRWDQSAAPVLYVAGCANGIYPCSGSNRRAMNPLTNTFLPANQNVAIGTLVPDSGDPTNGIFAAGQGIVDTAYKHPVLKIAPRFGLAWDVNSDQTFVVRGGGGLFFDRPSANTVYNTVNNPPFARNITVRYGRLQTLGAEGLTTEAPPSLTVFEYDMPLPASSQWNAEVQMSLPFTTSLSVAYTGQHSWDTIVNANINSIDLGTAFLPEMQDQTLPAGSVPGANSLVAQNVNAVRPFRGYSNITQRQSAGWRTYHSVQVSLNRRFRNGLAFGFNDTIGLSDKANADPRLEHGPDGSIRVRADQARADELLGDQHPRRHFMKGHFIWQLPRLTASSGALRALGLVLNDWSLSGIWTGRSGDAYSVEFAYDDDGDSVNLTGSPNFDSRVHVVGDPGSGCSSNRLRQFNTDAFRGPSVGSDGLESGNGYLRGCFYSQMDLAVARTINLGGGRTLQLRVDLFNAFNQATILEREVEMQLSDPSDPSTILNLPFDTSGNVVASRSLPRGAGFGVATDYQEPRILQGQIRFQF